MISAGFLFNVTVSAIALIVSVISVFGILAVIKYRKSQALALFWGISISKRKNELQLITIAGYLFAITFVFQAAYLLSNYLIYSYLAYIFGVISYSIVGYVLSIWALDFKRLL